MSESNLYDVAKTVTEEVLGVGTWVDPRPTRLRAHLALNHRVLTSQKTVHDHEGLDRMHTLLHKWGEHEHEHEPEEGA